MSTGLISCSGSSTYNLTPKYVKKNLEVNKPCPFANAGYGENSELLNK
jgi:hypothetical protein